MIKRMVAGGLWFFVGWFCGALAAWLLGLDQILAPMLGLVAAGMVSADPRHAIWKASTSRASATFEPASV